MIYFEFRKAAIDFNRKSQMISESVEEILHLVDRANIMFRNISGEDIDAILNGKNHIYYFNYGQLICICMKYRCKFKGFKTY